MSKNRISIGIAGGAGYTAGELLRLLLHHPNADISFIYSTSQAGKPVWTVHQDLIGQTELAFSQEIDAGVDVVFLCLGHGHSGEFLEKFTFASHTKIIDLSNEFRLRGKHDFVYALPELQRERIKGSKFIANPGCFATAIQLALLPLASKGWLQEEVHVHAVTGSTGAGQSLSRTTHFSWRANNVSIYKAFSHQHLGEIGQSLVQLQPQWEGELNFLPMRGNFTRGIFASAYCKLEQSEEELQKAYEDFYQDAPFTHIFPAELHLKQVVNTNQGLVQVSKHGDKALICSAIDNLLKGASGQAVQNMNLAFGLEETTGLLLKGSGF